MFWPELDAAGARAALRNALHALRQALGEHVVVNRGSEDVQVDARHLETDAQRLAALASGGRHAEALAVHAGPYLPGFFIKQGAEFERWLEEERQRLRGIAVAAAHAGMEQALARGDHRQAVECSRRALVLAPLDEPLLRHAMQVLDATGDRAAAMQAYEDFRRRVAAELEVSPAEETEQLAASLRAAAPRDAARPLNRADDPLTAAPWIERHPATPPRNPVRGRRVRWLAAATVLLGVTALTWRLLPRAEAANSAEVIVFAPPQAEGDTALAYVAAGLSREAAAQLAKLSARHVVRSSGAEWPRALATDPLALGRRLGATRVVTGTLTRRGDSLAFASEVVSVNGGERRAVLTVTFATSDLQRATNQLSAALAGALFRKDLPIERPPSVDPESFRLTLEGWHLQTRREFRRALASFTRATELDPGNADAWSGLGSSWASLAVSYAVPWEEGMERGDVANRRALALDSTQAPAIAGLGIYRALRQRSLAAGESLVTRALQLDPGNPLTYLTQNALYRHTWEWDKAREGMRVARQVDPLNPYFVDRAALIELCAARPLDALRYYREELAMDPGRPSGHLGVARSLAMLGRWDEAVEELRVLAKTAGDSVLAVASEGARGEAGYWRVMEADGRRKLAGLRKSGGWIAPSQEAMFMVGAGELDAGLERLETHFQAGEVGLSRLPCFAEVDRIRSWPRFQALLRRLDAIPGADRPPG